MGKIEQAAKSRRGLLIWLIVSQVLAVASLLFWLVVAGLSVMAFDFRRKPSGLGICDYDLVISNLSNPDGNRCMDRIRAVTKIFCRRFFPA